MYFFILISLFLLGFLWAVHEEFRVGWSHNLNYVKKHFNNYECDEYARWISNLIVWRTAYIYSFLSSFIIFCFLHITKKHTNLTNLNIQIIISFIFILLLLFNNKILNMFVIHNIVAKSLNETTRKKINKF